MSVTGTNISLTLRNVKGSELTYSELDGNQSNLKNGIENHSHDEFSLTTHNHNLAYDALGAASTVQSNLDTHVGLSTSAHGGIVSNTDSRLTDARPASDVSAWAKAATKPTYTYIEVGAAPSLGSDDNYMTDAEKVKLSGIADGAEVNVNADWNAISGGAQILNKPIIPSISGLLNEAAHDALDHTGLTGVLALGTTGTTACAGNDSRLVTNGNSHDHSGGDGAQISYSSLSGAPTSMAPPDGDKGDITVSGLGATWTIDNSVVTNAKLNPDVFSTDREWSGSQRGTVVTDNDGSFDMNAGQNFLCTPTAGFTLTFTNITAGQSGMISLVNPSAYTISKAAAVKCNASMLANISAAGTYKLEYWSPDGTTVQVTASGALS